MLSLLKKSGGDKAVVALPWRPDFRDVTQLPDTKTVRTAFFVNIVALAIAGTLLLVVVQREWAIASLGHTLADVESRLESATPDSKKAVEAYKLFQAEEAKFTEAFAFAREPFHVQDFLLNLGAVLPPGVKVNRVDYRGPGQTVVLNGSVKGIDAAASDVASNFVKQLQERPEFTRYFGSVTLTNLGRNADEGSLNLELVLAFKKPEPPKDAKGAAGK